MSQKIGILTAGGDSPGLNAAIRALGKSLLPRGYKLIGFMGGFEGLAHDITRELGEKDFSGILTIGGTIIHTSRHKPNKMPFNGKVKDMTADCVATYKKHNLHCLICIGGGGTHKNAHLLAESGLNIITLPKTIDDDLAKTDSSIGFDSALEIATDAIDALHSTAGSHKRIMLVEIMGHRAGWLALCSGVAGGADVILIPEIPYNLASVAKTVENRVLAGKPFSIIAVAEGAMSVDAAAEVAKLSSEREKCGSKKERAKIKERIDELTELHHDKAFEMAAELERLTGIETKVTVLGYLQRGGKPSSVDRICATRLGCAAAECVAKSQFGVMVALRGGATELVPLAEVVGIRKEVPPDCRLIADARTIGIGFGD